MIPKKTRVRFRTTLIKFNECGCLFFGSWYACKISALENPKGSFQTLRQFQIHACASKAFKLAIIPPSHVIHVSGTVLTRKTATSKTIVLLRTTRMCIYWRLWAIRFGADCLLACLRGSWVCSRIFPKSTIVPLSWTGNDIVALLPLQFHFPGSWEKIFLRTLGRIYGYVSTHRRYMTAWTKTILWGCWVIRAGISFTFKRIAFVFVRNKFIKTYILVDF